MTSRTQKLDAPAASPKRPRRRGAATDELFETSRPGGLAERVHRSLAHAIASGRFERGVRLPSEPELCVAFAVSRPVVRQALERLRAERLIESQRGSGNYVAGVAPSGGDPPSPDERAEQSRRMMDDLEFRLLVEPQSAFLAARRRGAPDIERMERTLRRFEQAQAAQAITHHFDFLFHEAIALATANARFVEAVRTMAYRADDARIPMRDLVHFQPLSRGAAVLREHRAIFALIQARDAEQARAAMTQHIESAAPA